MHIPRAPVPTSELISLEFGTGLDSICFGFSRHLPGIWTYQVYTVYTGSPRHHGMVDSVEKPPSALQEDRVQKKARCSKGPKIISACQLMQAVGKAGVGLYLCMCELYHEKDDMSWPLFDSLSKLPITTFYFPPIMECRLSLPFSSEYN